MLRDLQPQLDEPAVRDLLALAVGLPNPERMAQVTARYARAGNEQAPYRLWVERDDP